MLGELIDKLPYHPTFPHEFNIVVYEGEAIHFTQQVCHAIKQHNEEEHRRKNARWEEQIAQAKRPGGVVTLPDYEMNIIPWILKYRRIDPKRNIEDMNQLEGYQPRCELYADYPRGRQKKPSKMAELVHKLFPPKEEEMLAPKQDPFEKWLGTSPIGLTTGVDKLSNGNHPTISPAPTEPADPRRNPLTPAKGESNERQC
jgi:hypothetical protein